MANADDKQLRGILALYSARCRVMYHGSPATGVRINQGTANAPLFEGLHGCFLRPGMSYLEEISF